MFQATFGMKLYYNFLTCKTKIVRTTFKTINLITISKLKCEKIKNNKKSVSSKNKFDQLYT